jgi:hypothetical protein
MALALKAPTFVIYPEQNIFEAATDRLGNVQAQMAPLKNEEAAIKEILRDSPESVVEGRLFRATISAGKAGTKVDWEALARASMSEARLAKLLPAFTTETEAGAARVSAKAMKGV